jgi:hypothetical protein
VVLAAEFAVELVGGIVAAAVRQPLPDTVVEQQSELPRRAARSKAEGGKQVLNTEYV